MYLAAAEGGDAARTIARIWRVTLDRLADDPLAGQVLRILAWYAPDGIPRTLLDGLADPPAVLRAVGRLAAYSMLTASVGALAVHRLVQAVARTPDPGDPHRVPQAIDAARHQATRQLADALPDSDDPADWPAWRMLLPHIDALASRAPPDAGTEDTAYLLNQAGVFLDGQGQPGRAAGNFQRALADRERVLGADHPDTLTSRNNLAGAYESAGGPGRGDPAARADPGRPGAGAGRRPPRHPDLAEQPRRRLPGGGAAWAEAIPLFEQTLADSERVLGADHPETLSSRNNLAYAYQDGGPLAEAIPLFEQTLADRERVLGADHPDTLASRNNLAVAYQAAGRLGRGDPAVRADPGRQRAGAGRRPPPHPDLAEQPRLRLPGRRDRMAEAIPLFEQTLADRERVLGADHPDTLTSRNNLAGAYKSAGGPGPRPSRCSSRPWPTGSGCWAPTTPTP